MLSRMKVLILLAILLSILATYAIYKYIQNAKDSVGKPKVVNRSIVVANNDLQIGWKLRESDLRISEWPEDLIPQNSYSEIPDLIDRVTKIDIFQGEPIIENKLAPAGSEGGFSSIIPPGYRAIAVNVEANTGVSGFVLPNARVDVLVTVPSVSDRDNSKTKIILEDIKVLAVDQTYERKGDDPVLVQTVTLLVTPDGAEKLALASSEGKLQLSLRNNTDRSLQPTAGVRLQELISTPRPTRTVRRSSPTSRQTVSTKPEEKTIEVLRSGERSEVKVEVKKKKEEGQEGT